MEVRFDCPHCGVTIEADALLSGGNAECPECEAVVLVPAPGFDAGMTLGGFHLDAKLGAGAMGEVFLATQLSMGRQVALKILPPALNSSAAYLNRFQHEVRLLARLDHPNIVRAYEAGSESGIHYLAMTYVRGENLEDVLEQQGPFSEEDTITIAIEVARALDYAWENHQILHRDIKPANLMIDEQGTILLMDMGISKCVTEESNMTMTGMVVGTPYYMSPEQAAGDKDLDRRADLYSLGVTLYMLTTGVQPFPGNTPIEVLSKVMKGEVTPLVEAGEDVSEAFSQVVMRMMARDREDRHATWQELIGELRTLQSGSQIASPATQKHAAKTMGLPVAAPGKKKGWVVPMVIAAALAVLLIGGVVALMATRGDDSGELVRRPPPVPAEVPAQAAVEVESAPVVTPAPTPVTTQDEGIAGMYAYAIEFAMANPDEVGEALRKLRAVERDAEGTEYAAKAEMMISLLQSRQSASLSADGVEEVALAMTTEPEQPVSKEPGVKKADRTESNSLMGKVLTLATAGKQREAADLIEETLAATSDNPGLDSVRLRRMADSLRRQSEGQRRRPDGSLVRGFLGKGTGGPSTISTPSTPAAPQADPVGELIDMTLAGDLSEAREQAKALTEETLSGETGQMVGVLAESLAAASNEAQLLQRAYLRSKGKAHTFKLKDGDKTLTVLAVSTSDISGKEAIKTQHGTASFKRLISFGDLTLEERLNALGQSGLTTEVLGVTRGLVALQDGHQAAAKHYLGQGGAVGAKMLDAMATEVVPSVPSGKRVSLNPEQQRALRDLLSVAALPQEETDPQVLASWIAAMPYSSRVVEELKGRGNELGREFRGTAGEGAYAPLLKAVAGLRPLDKQKLEKALKKLEKANPGFSRDDRAFRELRTTDTSVIVMLKHTPRLRDISALAGLPITHLRLDDTAVTDLSPLKGMPLQMLSVASTPVRDLSPVTGAPISRLEIQKSGVSELGDVMEMTYLETLILPSNIRGAEAIRRLPYLIHAGYSWDRMKRTDDFLAELR